MTAAEVLARLEAEGTEETVEGMACFGIPNDRAFGVTMGEMRRFAKRIGRDHALALELWDTGWYEARTVAVLVAEPDELSRNTACFHLFDRTGFAWDAVPDWAASEQEFVRRAGYALIWALSVHDRAAPDDRFVEALEIIERGATDERNFVKKAVNMALRATGKQNTALNAAAIETARRLADSDDSTAAWIGRHALRELESDRVQTRLAK